MPDSQPSRQHDVGKKRIDHHARRPFLAAVGLLLFACVFSISADHLLPSVQNWLLVLIPALASIAGLAYFWHRLTPVAQRAFDAQHFFQAVGGVRAGYPCPPSPGLAGDRDPANEGPKVLSLTFTDSLTGLGNKSRMTEKFNRLSESRKDTPSAFTVGLVNLDGMKPINDLFGTSGGDEIIKQCALRLAAAVDGDGFVCRYGGDEFAFIFPHVADEEGAGEKGRVLQNVLLAPFHFEGRTVRLSGSFGFAVFPDAGESFDEIMANIETALYHSKRRGRGRVTIYTREIEELVRENARIEQSLRNAIAENVVKPHFQPIISLQDGRLLGFEALARWIDPELGFVSPGKFIPLAEERGIIAPLTDSLLLQAARTAAEWPSDLFLSFNLSSVQLVDLSTAGNIKDILRHAGLPPHRLELEVTETAMMSDPETAAMIIDDLHKAGIRVSMDDFGTGQSSLGRLRELKLDKVKIDRAFIMAIGEDKPAEHIVRAILEMCAGLELTVVAEGIEELHQAESLKLYGCHAGQGFLFGKPQDAHRTMSYIRDFTEKYREEVRARIA